MAYPRRAGPAVEPDSIENSGTDNSETDPRVVLFVPDVRPCIVSVPAGFSAAVRVKINAFAENDFDNDGDDDGPGYFTIAAGETRDVSLKSVVAVKRVSFITQNAGDDLDDVSVVGWC